MKSTEFCYWLQGFFEIKGSQDLNLTHEQATIIKKHLDMVFYHEIDKQYPAEEQSVLNDIHNDTSGFLKPNQNLGKTIMRC